MNMAASTSNKIFISFRSADDINNFNRLLYLFPLTIKSHLDEKLQKRDEIAPALLRAIQSSNISIIVFSKNYASSSRCLDELVQILQCREVNRQIVLPVFYEINPSQVRKQTGPYATAFSNFEEQFGDRMNKVHAWRAALKVATNLCGFDTQDTRMQSDLLKKIDHDLSEKINASEVNMYISIYPLGYDVCREYLSVFLQVGADDVLVVGIAGEAKMGKTVIAKAIYDGTFRTFDGSSFLIGVGQKSKEPNGMVQLQEKLVFDLLGEMINITSVIRGVELIKERLCHKKVLIVIDDVDDLPQLLALVGSREWFGLGSKIIITSRDLPLLRIFGVDQMFMAKGLPLPLDIQELWEPYQQSCRKVAGLKEYIQTFSYLTNEKVKYLEECLIKERRKGAIQKQIISELQHVQGEGTACINSCTMLEGVGSISRGAVDSSLSKFSSKPLSKSLPGDITSPIPAEFSCKILGHRSSSVVASHGRTMTIFPQSGKKRLDSFSVSKGKSKR